MTPTTLNKRIRNGETFWAKFPHQPFREYPILQARSVKGKCRVQIKTFLKRNNGKMWIPCDEINPLNTTEWIPLTAEGRMDWATN